MNKEEIEIFLIPIKGIDSFAGLDLDIMTGQIYSDGVVVEYDSGEHEHWLQMNVIVSGPSGDEFPTRLIENFDRNLSIVDSDIILLQSAYKTDDRYVHYYIIEQNGEFEYKTDRVAKITNLTSLDWWINARVVNCHGLGEGELTENGEAEFNDGCTAILQATFITRAEYKCLFEFLN